MKNMSFAMTTDQVRRKRKTMTRRLGWKKVRAGDVLMACEKCQGIRKGGLVRICPIKVTKAYQQSLAEVTQADCEREGFPDMTPALFVEFFCDMHTGKGLTPNSIVTVIEFEYLT